MTRARQARRCGLVLVAGALTACAPAQDRPGPAEPPGSGAGQTTTVTLPTPTYGAAYLDSLPHQVLLADPSGACRPAVPTGTVLAPGLSAQQTVVAAVVCGHRADPNGTPGVVTRQARGAALHQLAAALHLPSARTPDICDASGRRVPVFAVQLPDGHWVHPDLPSDGCHPRSQVLTALAKILERP